MLTVAKRALTLSTAALSAPLVGAGALSMLATAIKHAGERGVSVTAYLPLMTRALLHEAGDRTDPLAPALAAHALGERSYGALVAGWAPSMRALGNRPRSLRHREARGGLDSQVLRRTAFLDDVVAEAQPNIPQVVLLGAGYDTRAHRSTGEQLFFELDRAETQAKKRAALAAARAPLRDVRYAPTDFRSDSLLPNLVSVGFDPAKPALFIWEGVSYYLPEEIVRATFNSLSQCAPGSQVAFDYFGGALMRSPSPRFILLRRTVAAAGEPFRSSLEGPPKLSEYLDESGFDLTRHVALRDGSTVFGGLALATRR